MAIPIPGKRVVTTINQAFFARNHTIGTSFSLPSSPSRPRRPFLQNRLKANLDHGLRRLFLSPVTAGNDSAIHPAA
jgi:hypothetical protein